jgi:predicted amidohydrolase
METDCAFGTAAHVCRSFQVHIMDTFIIAAAQSRSVEGDIVSNVRVHVEFVRVAVEHDVDVILFPELSLTGYEPEIAEKLAIHVDDERLSPLREQAHLLGITIIAGIPVACSEGKPYIGAVVLNSDDSCVYLKQHLHPGEETFFSSSHDKEGCVVDVKGKGVGMAICADINHASHARKVAKEGASVYTASVLITDSGYADDARRLQRYATEHSMTVLMANHSAPTGGYIPAGKSAIWDEGGRIIARAEGIDDSLIIAEKGAEGWLGKVIQI